MGEGSKQKPGEQDRPRPWPVEVQGEGFPASACPPSLPGGSYPKGMSASLLDRSPVVLVRPSSWLSPEGGSCLYPTLQRGK